MHTPSLYPYSSAGTVKLVFLLCYNIYLRYVVVQRCDDDVARKKQDLDSFFHSNFFIYFPLFFFPRFYQRCNHIRILTCLLVHKTFYSYLALASIRCMCYSIWYFPSLDFKLKFKLPRRLHKNLPNVLEVVELFPHKEFPETGLHIVFQDALCPFAFVCKNEVSSVLILKYTYSEHVVLWEFFLEQSSFCLLYIFLPWGSLKFLSTDSEQSRKWILALYADSFRSCLSFLLEKFIILYIWFHLSSEWACRV